jgi:cytochrome c peroxidase
MPQNVLIPADHALMLSKFSAAMAKLAVVGQIPFFLTDCSDVIPIPKVLTTGPTLPAGKTLADVQAAVRPQC